MWYEELERHRQPALYYLSSQEDSAGPHLICDWNGAAANFRKLEMNILRELTAIDNRRSTSHALAQLARQATVTHLPPTDAFESIVPKQTSCSRSLLTQDDGSQFDLLTVPPVSMGLLKRLLKRSKLGDNSSSPPDETELASSSSSSGPPPSQPPIKRKVAKAAQDKRMSKKLRSKMSQRATSNAKR